MGDLLVDTDVLVDHLRGSQRFDPASATVHCSVVTRCELFSGIHTGEEAVRRLLDPFVEHAVDQAIAERAGRLRRAHHIRTPDALIAATALEHGLTLLTRNTKDFAQIRGLKVRAPA